MKCMLSMSVFSHFRRLRIGEDSLKGDDIDGCFYILFYFYITSSMHSRPLVPRQTWRLTGNSAHAADVGTPPADLTRDRLGGSDPTPSIFLE